MSSFLEHTLLPRPELSVLGPLHPLQPCCSERKDKRKRERKEGGRCMYTSTHRPTLKVHLQLVLSCRMLPSHNKMPCQALQADSTKQSVSHTLKHSKDTYLLWHHHIFKENRGCIRCPLTHVPLLDLKVYFLYNCQYKHKLVFL